mgnify:CR=1 FL=1
MSIEIKNLNKNYKKFEAVKNLNFKIESGSIIGLLGPNGCGKTTTLGMILGLIKPTKGKILVKGKNVENEKKLFIVETLWRIIYSDKTSDMYESNLMRRLTGLLYLSAKEVGDIKEKIKLEYNE